MAWHRSWPAVSQSCNFMRLSSLKRNNFYSMQWLLKFVFWLNDYKWANSNVHHQPSINPYCPCFYYQLIHSSIHQIHPSLHLYIRDLLTVFKNIYHNTSNYRYIHSSLLTKFNGITDTMYIQKDKLIDRQTNRHTLFVDAGIYIYLTFSKSWL